MNLNLTLSDYNSIYYENCTSLLLLVSYYFQYIFFSVYISRLFIYIFCLFISYTSLIYFLFFTVLFIVFILSLMNLPFYFIFSNHWIK
jgi:hypothetical protein